MRTKKLVFLFLNQNIGCGYSKEPSQWDGSYEQLKHMLKLMCKKNINNFTLRNFVYLNLGKYKERGVQWLSWQSAWLGIEGWLFWVVLLLWILFVICVSCLSLSYSHVCSLPPCGHLLGKDWPVGSLVCDVFLVFLSLSHMVSWVRCGTWLYWFLIFAFFLTFTKDTVLCPWARDFILCLVLVQHRKSPDLAEKIVDLDVNQQHKQTNTVRR